MNRHEGSRKHKVHVSLPYMPFTVDAVKPVHLNCGHNIYPNHMLLLIIRLHHEKTDRQSLQYTTTYHKSDILRGAQYFTEEGQMRAKTTLQEKENYKDSNTTSKGVTGSS